MKAEVKILIEGFTSEKNEGKTQPTVTLVIDKNIIMIVDPGVLESQKVLIDKLAIENLNPGDVNYVFITHSHLDHYKNVGMFPNAKIIEYFGVWDKNYNEDRVENFTENIRILATPGHDYTSLSLFVNTEHGIVAICGDVFWSENKPEVDVYAQNLQELDRSRRLVLDVADFVVPGHGAMYKVDKNKILIKSNAGNNFVAIKKNSNKKLGRCRKCKKVFKRAEDQCGCQQSLCYRCCECDIDCQSCNCKHKK